ncbi:MAG TPA: MlaD family protein [Polyangiaceae bacterium]|jgi:phospholipid/cholesterol/gamma-HCH transport system substrate-binding protein|nr:MlaD family protein [Polyangiaceae bacterium]
MATLTQGAKVGAFLLISAAGGLLVYRTVKKEVGDGSGYTVHAYLNDASGLAPHSRVTIAGIPVGSIQKISLEQGRARVDVRLAADVALNSSATLGVRSASLLGENIIVLTPGVGEPKKKDGDEIATLPEPKSFDNLKEQLSSIADDIKKVSHQLAESVGTDRGGQQIKDILRNVADATEQLDLAVRENRAGIRHAIDNVDRITSRGAPQIDAILENVRIITEDVKVMLAKNGGGAEGTESGELRQTIERINRASKSLESTLAHADNIAGRMDRGEGTLGRLSKDEALINEVQGVAEGVNDYVDSLRRLQTVVGLRSDYNYLSSTVKSYVELRLYPREDKYYLIELINDPRGVTTYKQEDVDSTDPNRAAHSRTVTTTTQSSLRFTVQFAKRLGPFTGRFGIKESSGGLGWDTTLFRNRLEIVQDVFGFGEEAIPRYRVYAAWQFLDHFWLLGGVDHILLEQRRDFFMGLQLRFTDEDLKTILPFAGGLRP